MNSLFSPDNPIMQFLTRVGDLILLNFLTVFCSLPILTAGASLTAMHKVCQSMVYETDSGIVKSFFRAFRENFRQATVVWLGMLLVAAALICDVLLVMAYFGGSKLMYVLLGVLAVLVLGVCAWLLPLIARYSNSLRQHLTNAVSLAVVKLPKTLIMVFMNLAPVLVLLVSMQVFVQTLIFWVVIGFAFLCYLQESLLKSVYSQLEKGNQSVTLGM